MYFAKFPKIAYDILGDGNSTVVTDLLRRVKIKSSIKDSLTMFDTYDVQGGESPETIAYKLYGDSKYHYVILLLNNITDRYYGWPLGDSAFETYVTNKYAEPGAIHHYEVTQSSGRTTSNGPDDYSHRIEVNSDASGAQSVSNYEYERRIQDQLRQIKILNPDYLSAFEQEFNKLISI
jgi:hypothetical protein